MVCFAHGVQLCFHLCKLLLDLLCGVGASILVGDRLLHCLAEKPSFGFGEGELSGECVVLNADHTNQHLLGLDNFEV